jgi:hypothetical protein
VKMPTRQKKLNENIFNAASIAPEWFLQIMRKIGD